MCNSVKNRITCNAVFQKVVLLEISRNLPFAILTPNNFLKLSRLMSVIQFFLSELHAKNYRFQSCAFLKFRKISEITSAVETLYRSRRSQTRFAEYLL